MSNINQNAKRAAKLGMPFGTAQNKLRKSIMFNLVQRLGLDLCYRCDQKIESVDYFSIEHKKDWLNQDNAKELFFDLENISFSHRKCNTPYNEGSYLGASPNRINCPEGTSWCRRCKEFLPDDSFYADSRRWNNKARVCKAHSEIEKGRKTHADYPHLKNP